MPEPPAPTFAIRIDHFLHRGDEDAVLASLANLEQAMSEIGDYLGQMRTAIDDMKGRIATDLDELRRLIEASRMTDDEKTQAQGLIDDIKGVDLDPNFPPPPVEPEPAPEPEPTEPPPGP